jgi:hypothetical protein
MFVYWLQIQSQQLISLSVFDYPVCVLLSSHLCFISPLSFLRIPLIEGVILWRALAISTAYSAADNLDVIPLTRGTNVKVLSDELQHVSTTYRTRFSDPRLGQFVLLPTTTSFFSYHESVMSLKHFQQKFYATNWFQKWHKHFQLHKMKCP